MYLSYYKLKRKPFQVSTDPKFLWLGQKHKDALATMTYGILYNYGYILITGDVGTGKTTLVNALIEDLGDEVVLAKINDPGLEALDFFNLVLSTFKVVGRHTTKGTFLAAFNKFLQSCYSNQEKVVLILDEAQRLSPELLEDIRHLSNTEKEILNIVFVGQKEFNDMLLDGRNRALRQRIGINYHVDPLTEEETKEYIDHRLKTAGSRSRIFSADAIREIFLFTEGIPRLINIVSDRALLNGYVKQEKLLRADIIKECVEELRLPGEKIPVLEDEIEQHALRREEDVSVEWDLSGKNAEVHTEELEPPALRREKRFLSSPAVYVIPVIALLLVLTGYLYYPGLDSDVIKSSELKAVKQEIARELPSIRVEKPVSEILAPKASEPVKMGKIEAEETGSDEVGASAASTEKTLLEHSIVDSASEPPSVPVPQLPQSLLSVALQSGPPVLTDGQKERSVATAQKTEFKVTARRSSSPREATQLPKTVTPAAERRLPDTQQRARQSPAKKQKNTPVPRQKTRKDEPSAQGGPSGPQDVVARVTPSLREVTPSLQRSSPPQGEKQVASPDSSATLSGTNVATARPRAAAEKRMPDKITVGELSTMLRTFIAGYEKGDLNRFMGLFAEEARTNERKNRDEIRKDYENLFLSTGMRRMVLQDLRWDLKGNWALGWGNFDLKVQSKGEQQVRTYSGSFAFQIERQGQAIRITRLYHSQNRVKANE